jgi:hypothetical protein
MGKQKQLKKLKRMAKELPAETETHTQSITVTGRELLSKGIREVKQGMATALVKPGKTYILRGQVERPVDHAAKMKQAYLIGGTSAVATYLADRLATDKPTAP